jgi:tetratricopeptide (TPR) repeat protein
MHMTRTLDDARALADLIRGNHRPYLALLDSPPGASGVARLAWAHTALYCGRVDEAAEVLDVLDALDPTAPDVWREHHRTLAAEVLFARGEYDAVEELLAGVECPTSLLNLARVSYKRCDWHEAERRATRAVALAADLGLDFIEGRALHILAESQKERGREEAEGVFRRAIDKLQATEGGRFLGYAECSYGWLLADRGDLCGAESHILAAYETAIAVGHEGDLALYTLARLEIAHRMGRYAEVVAASGELVDMCRAQRSRPYLTAALRIAALSLLALDRPVEALARAEEATSIAWRDESSDWPLYRALELRVRARSGKGTARECQRFLREVDRAEVPRWSALARLWTVDAALTENPELAAVTVADYWPARLVPGCWLVAAEAHAVAAVRRPYRVTVEGEFYASARDPRAFPRPRDARRYTQLAITAGAVKIVGDGWGAGADLAALLDVGASQASSKAAEVRRLASAEDAGEQLADGGSDRAK